MLKLPEILLRNSLKLHSSIKKKNCDIYYQRVFFSFVFFVYKTMSLAGHKLTLETVVFW